MPPPPKINLREVLFDKQIAAIEDNNPFVSLCTTRRAGKSTAKGAKALEKANEYPGCEIPYIALTRDSCERIVWKVLKDFVDQYKLPFKAIDSELKLKGRDGSTIFLIGADQKNFIERFRGAKFPIAFIDESQSFKQPLLQSLVQDILEPCVSDYQGQIILSGTPGPIPKGFFYETTKGMHGFTHHKWSVVDNPFLPHITDEWLNQMLARKGQTRDNPTFRREWLGEWVEDLDALVYKYKRGRNDYDGDLPHGVRSVLGIDYGFNDKTSFSVVSYHPHYQNRIWVQHVEGHQGMIPHEISIRLQQLIAKYKPSVLVADTGGLGKSITEEMRRRYGLPIQAAEKTDKMTWISLMNGDFIDGNILVHSSCEEYKEQALSLDKDDNGKENPLMPNDLLDSTLYAYRSAYAYASRPVNPLPKDPVEKFKQQERKWLEKESQAPKKEWWDVD